MKNLKTFLTVGMLLIGICASAQIKPTSTHLFAHRDTCDLYFDYYKPAVASNPVKPTILFVFGGGFIRGTRDDEDYLPWFKKLTDDGYSVVSIDYRLGLKGQGKMGLGKLGVMKNAVAIGVEDVCSAVAYLDKHAGELNIKMDNIVLAGSSAGAIISLQTEWFICNNDEHTKELPANFNFAGVMSYSGAIFSSRGAARYHKTPCPTAFLHGTADRLVPYGYIQVLNYWWEGSYPLVRKCWKRRGYNYNFYRFKDNSHEIASSFMQTYDLTTAFLEHNVMAGEHRIIDKEIVDLPIKKLKLNSTDELYKDN